MGGGGGGSKKKSSGGGGESAPAQAAPLDAAALMQAASAAAAAQVRQQYASMIENYPKLEDLSFGTVQRLAGQLNNQETKDAQGYIRKALALGEMQPDAISPTSIEQELYNQGESDLALGRSLSAEQIRDSQQAARASMAARGLGSSMATTAAEILNRDAYATARDRERRGFAAAANDQFINGVTGRRLQLANLYTAGAGNLIAADPYNRAVGPGFQYSGGTQGNMMQQIGNTYSSANNMFGGVANFNANMAESRYNSYMNNQAAMNAARMQSNALGAQAGALGQQGTMGMLGGIGGGVLTGVGLAI